MQGMRLKPRGIAPPPVIPLLRGSSPSVLDRSQSHIFESQVSLSDFFVALSRRVIICSEGMKNQIGTPESLPLGGFLGFVLFCLLLF